MGPYIYIYIYLFLYHVWLGLDTGVATGTKMEWKFVIEGPSNVVSTRARGNSCTPL